MLWSANTSTDLADGGYNDWQVDAAVAKAPLLRMEIVKRSDDMKGFVVLPPRRVAKHNTFRWFKTYDEANKWLLERLPIECDNRGPYRNRYLAPETVRKTTLLGAVGSIPGRQRPEDDLFEFTVRPI
jgi:hypothetical protein